MHRRQCLAALAAGFGTSGWGAPPAPASAPASAPPVSPERITRATTALRDIEAGTGGRLGVQLTDGEGQVLLAQRADERFPMCSTFKSLAAAAVLLRVDRNEETLARRVMYKKSDLLAYAPEAKKHLAQGMTMGELCQAAVEWSDNTAANLVVASLGGPDGVTKAVRGLGDTLTRLDRYEPMMSDSEPGDERDTTSPAAMARDLRLLLLDKQALSLGGRATLQHWMRDCKTGADTLRAGLPPQAIVMNKTGTGDHGTRNDAGLFWLSASSPPHAIAVYLTGAKVDRAAQDKAIADVARAVTAMLAPG